VSVELAGVGRFADPAVLILSSLAGGAKHGYAMSKDIEAFAGVVLQPATLYGAVSRLETRGLIEALPVQDRRRPFRLTATGARALAGYLRSVETVLQTGLGRLAQA
jgi:DNA-binding PadR family transcriptional regulator